MLVSAIISGAGLGFLIAFIIMIPKLEKSNSFGDNKAKHNTYTTDLFLTTKEDLHLSPLKVKERHDYVVNQLRNIVNTPEYRAQRARSLNPNVEMVTRQVENDAEN